MVPLEVTTRADGAGETSNNNGAQGGQGTLVVLSELITLDLLRLGEWWNCHNHYVRKSCLLERSALTSPQGPVRMTLRTGSVHEPSGGRCRSGINQGRLVKRTNTRAGQKA